MVLLLKLRVLLCLISLKNTPIVNFVVLRRYCFNDIDSTVVNCGQYFDAEMSAELASKPTQN